MMKSVITAVALFALAGCKADEQGAAEPEAPTAPPAPTRPAAPSKCETLDRAECMGAKDCTMYWIADSRYECRASSGTCEVDLIQTDKKTCESRDGCAWSPGECYCKFPGYGQTQVPDKQKNSGGACACGGGKPPRCMTAGG